MNALASLPEQLASIDEARRADARALAAQVANVIGSLAARPLDERLAGRMRTALARVALAGDRRRRGPQQTGRSRPNVRQITRPIRSKAGLSVSRTGNAA